MAKRTAAKSKPAGGAETDQQVEPMVIALAEKLGAFLGRVQHKADGWLEGEALREQVSQIRDGAADLLAQVNKATGSARKSVGKSAPAKTTAKAKAAVKSKGRSGGVVDAPAKRHRKPPPQELFDPRLGEPMGKQMGQKHLKRRGRG
jgi:hypothetical protein